MKKKLLIITMAVTIGSGAAHTAKADDRPYCREFTQSFSIGGEREEGYGIACLQPDRSWKIVSQEIPQEPRVQYIIKERPIYVHPRRVVFVPQYRHYHRPQKYGHRRHH